MTETKDSHMNKRKVILIILGILILLLIILSTTWAFYQIDNTDSSTKTTGSINLDCIKIEYVEEGFLSPDYAYPIKDDYAKEHIKPVKVRITNTCEANLEEINYSLVLTTLKKDDNNITSDKIRLNSKRALNLTPGSEPENYDEFLKPTYLDELRELSNEYSKEALSNDILNREKDEVKVFDGYNIIDTRVIDENFIKNNSESVYEIQLWIDYYEGDKEVYNGSGHDGSYDNSTQNKTFISALSVVANPYEKYNTNFGRIMSYLRSKDTEKHLSENLQGGMYRFQGIYTDDVRNYICLGDNCCKEESCPNDSNDDMYRIIGITSTGELKVIKKTSLSNAEKWWNDSITDIKWPQSLIYQSLNGISDESNNPNLNDTNSYYYSLDNKLKELIVNNYSWMYGDTTSAGNYNGVKMYEIESGSREETYNKKTETGYEVIEERWNERIEAPLGIIYLSDYYFAYKTSEDDAGNPENDVNAIKGWIHLSHNEKNNIIDYKGYEWTMDRFGFYPGDGGGYPLWYTRVTGGVHAHYMDTEVEIRPTFYLSNEIELFGEGTLETPFQVVGVG